MRSLPESAGKMLLVGCLAVCLASGAAHAQDGAADLRLKVDELEARLKLAEQTVDILEKETERLRAENARLKGGEPKPMTSSDADPFRVGVVWVGEAKSGDRTANWAISISERDGNKFSGVAAIVGPDGKKSEVPVSGTAPEKDNGLVVLESPLVGRAKMFMRGRLVNGEIALAFSGTTRLGDKLFGSATLRPKN
jgi:hypothetical protein